MTVTVLYFARFREKLGIEQEDLTLPVPSTVAGITALLASRGGLWHDLFGCEAGVMVAINEQMAHHASVVADGDRVALFPPVTGG
jgi:sulfur-carrier protein